MDTVKVAARADLAAPSVPTAPRQRFRCLPSALMNLRERRGLTPPGSIMLLLTLLLLGGGGLLIYRASQNPAQTTMAVGVGLVIVGFVVSRGLMTVSPGEAKVIQFLGR